MYGAKEMRDTYANNGSESNIRSHGGRKASFENLKLFDKCGIKAISISAAMERNGHLLIVEQVEVGAAISKRRLDVLNELYSLGGVTIVVYNGPLNNGRFGAGTFDVYRESGKVEHGAATEERLVALAAAWFTYADGKVYSNGRQARAIERETADTEDVIAPFIEYSPFNKVFRAKFSFTDIDMVAAHNGKVLFVEFKKQDAEKQLGQEILYKQLSARGGVQYINYYGNPTAAGTLQAGRSEVTIDGKLFASGKCDQDILIGDICDFVHRAKEGQ